MSNLSEDIEDLQNLLEDMKSMLEEGNLDPDHNSLTATEEITDYEHEGQKCERLTRTYTVKHQVILINRPRPAQ